MPNLSEIKKIYAGSNLIYLANPIPPVSFWMEGLTTVVAAYSFTKLKAANTECCEIRENSDNLASIIGFDSNHRFDEAAARVQHHQPPD